MDLHTLCVSIADEASVSSLARPAPACKSARTVVVLSALRSRGQFVGSSGVDLRREIKRFIICRSQSNRAKHQTQACTVFGACSVFLYITSCTFIGYFRHDILKRTV